MILPDSRKSGDDVSRPPHSERPRQLVRILLWSWGLV